MEGVVLPVPLMLDKERHLKLSYPTLALAELELSRVWERKINLLTLLTDGIGLNDLRVLLWAALLWEDPSLTLLRVQDMIDPSRLTEIMDAVVQAWLRAWHITSDAPVEEETAPPLAVHSTGALSGVSPA